MADDEILPWDMIDCGVTKEFLLSERHKAANAATTPSCKDKCSGCGANKLVDKEFCRWCPGHKGEEAEYLGHNLKPFIPRVEEDDGKRDARGAGPAKNPGAKAVRTVRFRYTKGGALTYVSHLDVQRTFMRAIVKSKLPVYYTEGFNPIPKLVFASPLSVGSAGENELAQIKLTEDVSDADVKAALSAAMPDGVVIHEVYTPEVDFKKIKWAENEIVLVGDYGEDDLVKVKELLGGPMVVLKRTKSTEKEVDISQFVRHAEAQLECGNIVIRAVTCADNTNFLNPSYVAKAAMSALGGNGYFTIVRKQLMAEDGSIFR